MAEVTKKQRRAIEQRLGAALFDAVGLLVRQYFDGGADESAEMLGAEKNESFDERRFFALAQGVEAQRAASERGEDEGLFRAEARTSEPSALVRSLAQQEARWVRGAAAESAAYTSARALSESFERDARRYDGGFES